MNRSLQTAGISWLVLAALCVAKAKIGPETGFEGEYEGDGYAAQVIALAGGKFHVVGWRPGLPGVAPNAERIADADGAGSGEVVRFEGNIWKATVDAAGELAGSDDQGHKWTLHRIVRESPTLKLEAPRGALVLFDGRDSSAWAGGRMDERHLLLGGCESKQRFESFVLHLEFLVPSQGTAAALVIGGYYEFPICDSFGREPDERSCGALLDVFPPAVNASLPPGRWQTLDVDFTCAQFDRQDRKTRNAIVTVGQNGISVHRGREIVGPTDPALPETPGPGPLQLRDPAGETRFRNVWILEKR